METVISNIALIWGAPKDWNADAGLIWLTGLAVAGVLLLTLAPVLTRR